MAVTRKTKTVAIAEGESLSAVLYFGSSRLHALQFPAAIDGDSVTFQGSADGETFYNIADNGTELVYSAAASWIVLVDPAKFRALQWLKVRTGTAGEPAVQSAARTLTAIAVPVER